MVVRYLVLSSEYLTVMIMIVKSSVSVLSFQSNVSVKHFTNPHCNTLGVVVYCLNREIFLNYYDSNKISLLPSPSVHTQHSALYSVMQQIHCKDFCVSNTFST